MTEQSLRRLIGAVSATIAALVLITVISSYLTRGSLPRNYGTEKVPAITAAVDISFDSYHRPFVTADNLQDAFFAEGWLHASERLWQMEMLRRAGSGRLAELLGGDLLDTDIQLWRSGVPQLAQRLEQNAGASLLTDIDVYLAGVNASMAYHKPSPPEFLLLSHRPKPWKRADVFALGALMASQSANNLSNELLRLDLLNVLGGKQFSLFLRDHRAIMDYPYILAGTSARIDQSLSLSTPSGTPEGLRNLLDPAENPLMPRLGFGSNGWVVGPERSASRQALFAFDSHDELGVPNLFYQVHLSYGDGRELNGWSVPGLPGVINGYNERIAWGFTNIGDSQDLFLEKRDPDDRLRYLDGEEWYTADTETVLIPIRDGSEHELTIITTRNGPLISEDPPLALAWTVHQLDQQGLDSMIDFNTARNWQEFNAALDDFPAPLLNATYADIDGNIGFRTAGRLPLRGAGNGLFPLRGDKPENRWQGTVPAEEMPRLLNPPQAYIAAANAGVNAADSGPLVSADNAAPYRIARLQSVLSGTDKLTLDDMQQLQMDWYDSQAAMLLPTMLRDLDITTLSDSASYATGLLLEWQAQPVATRDSAAAIIFQHWYLTLARDVFEPALGEDIYQRLLGKNYVLNQALDSLILDDTIRGWWPDNRERVLSRTLNRSIESLGRILGPDITSWRLDQLQSVALEHQVGKELPVFSEWFACSRKPWGGSPAAVGRANYKYTRPFEVSHGATVRVVAELGSGIKASSIIPGGQSGHPLSEHYCDQLPAWLSGDLLPITQPDRETAQQFRLTPN